MGEFIYRDQVQKGKKEKKNTSGMLVVTQPKR